MFREVRFRLTVSDHNSGTSAPSECTVHQDGLTLGQFPVDQVARRLERCKKFFMKTVLLLDVDLRDPRLQIRSTCGQREILVLDREDEGYVVAAKVFHVLCSSQTVKSWSVCCLEPGKRCKDILAEVQSWQNLLHWFTRG